MAIASGLAQAAIPCIGRRWIPVFGYGLFSSRRTTSAGWCPGQLVVGGFNDSAIRTSHTEAVMSREIHLWYILPDEISSSYLLDQYLDLLCPNERDSILTIKDSKLQKGALLARVLVRTTLSRYQILRSEDNISPRLLKFRKNIFGKPELEWENGDELAPPLQFNLSHTPSLIACGISRNMQIGIDVEGKDRQLRNDILSFAKRYFTPKEVAYLQCFSDSDLQRQELIKMWTLKEAYVKALGRGFSAAPFRDFSIIFKSHMDTQGDADSTSILSHAKKPVTIQVEPCIDVEYLTTNWEFLLLELARAHYVAICAEKDDYAADDGEIQPPLVKVWKTIPLLRDEDVSDTELVTVCGFPS